MKRSYKGVVCAQAGLVSNSLSEQMLDRYGYIDLYIQTAVGTIINKIIGDMTI